MSKSRFRSWLGFQLRWLLDRSRRAYFRQAPAGLLFTEFDGRIAAGPFAGMKYLHAASGSTLAPKLLGCYERELHDTLDRLIRKSPHVLVDIGAAEGYYAVGIPLVAPDLCIASHAIDINPAALVGVQALAALNGVASRVKTDTSPDAALAASGPERRLVICDVEGAEAVMLDPVRQPMLRHSDLIVETHRDAAGVSTREILEDRFRATHQATWINVEPRGPQDARPSRWCRDPQFLANAVDEQRSRSHGWLVLEARG